MAHAVLSPSAMHRWANCPGSVALCAQVPCERPKPAAEEGSAAHFLAAEILMKPHMIPAAYKGFIIGKIKDEYHIVDGNKKVPADNWVVDDEMVNALTEYVDFVRALPGKLHVEVKVDILKPHVFGTADAIVVDKKKLTVVDFKFGVNSSVDAEDNPQMLCYAVGALRLNDKVEEVEVVIIQPRDRHNAESIRRWSLSVAELLSWRDMVLAKAAKAAMSDDAPVRAGGWCRWCDAAGLCPAMADKALALAQTSFEDIQPCPPALLPEKDLAKVLAAASLIRDWVSAVEEYAQRQMETGIAIPGWKLVQKKANRKWADEDKVRGALTRYRQDIYDLKLKSVAQMEKLVKERGDKPEDVLDGLWIIPDTGLTLAPSSDKRKAVTTINAAFEAVGDMSLFD